VALCILVAMMTWGFLQQAKVWRIFSSLSLRLLVAVLIPGIGIVRNGSQSWIGVGSLTLQPAEIAKVTTIIYISALLTQRKSYERIVQLKHFLILILPAALIMLQPDFGAVFILVVVVLI